MLVWCVEKEVVGMCSIGNLVVVVVVVEAFSYKNIFVY